MCLLAFAVNVALSLLLRPFARGERQLVVFYGHKLTGNLLPIYERLRSRHGECIRPVFLTMDRNYHRELKKAGFDSVWAVGVGCAAVLARARAVVSSHGLHSMQPLVRLSSIAFFDVWHGVPFKGFDADDFVVQRRYREVWVTSPLLAQLYVERFGFDSHRVAVTGYARTDCLVDESGDVGTIRRDIGAPQEGRLILFAPTWAQDASGRSLFPFGCAEADFLSELSGVAERHQAIVLVRAHLNSGKSVGTNHPRVLAVPFAGYPHTEAVLQVSDVLICDWSSIAFDFLLLDRPAVFLDVPAPFRKGFSLGPEYRYGPVVKSLNDLTTILDQILADPRTYRQEYMPKHQQVRRQVYGDFADGRSAERCVGRLISHLVKGESSR